MPRGFLVGRLFGTDIYCAPGFFLLLGLSFLWTENVAQGALLGVAIIISLLTHEFGHVFAVKWFLKGESTVVLWMLGGLTLHQPAPRPGQRLGIALLGPAFGLGLGIFAVAAALLLPRAAPPILHGFVSMLAAINLLWTGFNLLPIVPLDGGQALRAGLAAGLGNDRAARVMRVVSILLAGAVAVGAYLVHEPFVAVLAILLVAQNLKPAGGRLS